MLGPHSSGVRERSPARELSLISKKIFPILAYVYSGLLLIPRDSVVKARGHDQRGEKHMPQSERFEVLVVGSGTGGKLLAWHLAQSGHKTAVVERRWVGGSCPNIACMPSKNEIASAKVAHVARDGREYGAVTGSVTVDMATVRRRNREMVERQVAKHLQIYRASGTELIMGSGRFVASKTLEVNLNDGGTRELVAD